MKMGFRYSNHYEEGEMKNHEKKKAVDSMLDFRRPDAWRDSHCASISGKDSQPEREEADGRKGKEQNAQSKECEEKSVMENPIWQKVHRFEEKGQGGGDDQGKEKRNRQDTGHGGEEEAYLQGDG